MREYANDKYASVSSVKLGDLIDIYDDYLYMVREHEQYLFLTGLDELANCQREHMYPEGYHFPWKLSLLNEDEKQEFAYFIANNILGCDNKSYITIQHIKNKEDNGKPPVISIPPYMNTTIGMQLPSKIERYTISHPKDVTLKETEFLVDGRYKVVYTGEKYKDEMIREGVDNSDLLTEITLMLNISEAFRHNGYVADDKFQMMADEVYAEELIATNENNILEILGSFADKVKDVCNEKYQDKDKRAKNDNTNDSKENLMKAYEDGFMKVPKNFGDYVNIRDFMRHQWDTLDELEDFMPKKRTSSLKKRTIRINSYLKLFDKSYYERMQSYVEILHQMQQIIAEVAPHRIIRGMSESNEEFLQRVEAAYRRNPNQYLNIEANYPLVSQEFWDIENAVREISPKIIITDDICETDHQFERMFKRMEEYKRRTTFLERFHAIETYATGHCIRCGKNCNAEGKNLKPRDVWEYLAETGLMTADECDRWKQYTELRRKISHSYYNKYLKRQLDIYENNFFQDLHKLEQNLYAVAPDVRKKSIGVYEYTHPDGKVIVLDHINHTTSYGTEAPEQQFKYQDKTEYESGKYSSDRKPRRETYRNGVEFKIENEETTGVRFPNDVFVNMVKQSIDWGDRTRWYTNARYFNALQTPGSTIRTDKTLRVTSICEGNREILFANRNDILIDGRHKLLLDENGRIKEFDFRNAEGKVIKTRFERTEDKQTDVIMLPDGTKIMLSDHDVTVSHGNKVLSYDTRKDFVRTYDGTPIPPQTIKRGNGR